MGDVRMNLLDHQVFWTLTLVLVITFAVYLFVVLFQTMLILFVTLTDISHNPVDGLVDTSLASTCTCHRNVHQGCLMQHVVGVQELNLVQVGTKSREYSVSHRRLQDGRRVLRQQFDELWQLFRHLWRHTAGIDLRQARLHGGFLGDNRFFRHWLCIFLLMSQSVQNGSQPRWHTLVLGV